MNTLCTARGCHGRPVRMGVWAAALRLAFVLAVLSSSSQGRADVESPRVVLGPGAKGLKVGPGMNAAGHDLRGCEFVTQDLSGAVFDGCNLYGVRIEGCILRRASFRGTIFAGARIDPGAFDETCDFTDATVNGVLQGGFENFYSYGLRLSPKQLMSMRSYKTRDLRQCTIMGSSSWEPVQFDFRDADLREATLVRGDFTNSDFTNARINGLVLGDFTLAFSQLACTSDYRQRGLRIAVLPCGPYAKGFLGRCDFSGINLHGSYFAWLPADAIFTDARINRCAIRGLTKEQLCSTASYKEGNISGLRLMNADLSGCDFSGMNLSDCCFEQCRLAGAKFDDAVITGVRFLGGKSDPAFVLTFEQLKSTWNWKHGRMAGIALYGFPETARALPEHVRQQMRIGP